MVQAAARPSLSPGAARAPRGRFDTISIVLHWLTAVLMGNQLTTAWMLSQGIGDSAMILASHRSMGILTWAVVAARIIWRKNFAYLPDFPNNMPKLQQRAAVANEYGLYAVALLQPLSGLGQTLLRGRPFQLAAWQVQPIFAHNEVAYRAFRVLHEWGAVALLALIALHVGAALFHALILHDGIFRRMLP